MMDRSLYTKDFWKALKKDSARHRAMRDFTRKSLRETEEEVTRVRKRESYTVIDTKPVKPDYGLFPPMHNENTEETL